MKKEKIYITGHKNPDTDSICAALAYSYYMSRRSEYDPQPIRLGEVNRETQFVLDYFGMEAPRYKESIKPQVRDLSMDKAFTIGAEFSFHKALGLIKDHQVENLPVVDDNDQLIGIVSLSDITESYMEIWDDGVLGRSKTPVENIMQVLSAKKLTHPENPRPFMGKMSVYAMNPENIKDHIQTGDIVIIGDRSDAQEDAIDKEVSCIILTGGYTMEEEIRNRAEKKNITVLSTGFNSFMAARLLPQSVPVGFVMSRDNLATFELDDTVEEVQKKMSSSRYRSYPVLNHKGEVVGAISRYHLISYAKKKLILVDHNERSQSVDDIETADIVQIIDHHRVANIHTATPVYFRNEPVGSTCTIVAKIFLENGIRPPRAIAGLLMAAIISDTLLFRSPTATDEDRQMVDVMSKIAQIDPETFAMEMFKAGTSLEGVEPEEILNTDVKEFKVEDKVVRVAQVFSMDLENLDDIKRDILKAMTDLQEARGDHLFVLLLTDIFEEKSEVLAVGDYAEALAETFGEKLLNQSFMAQGLLSRKKQMMPKINETYVSMLSQA